MKIEYGLPSGPFESPWPGSPSGSGRPAKRVFDRKFDSSLRRRSLRCFALARERSGEATLLPKPSRREEEEGEEEEEDARLGRHDGGVNQDHRSFGLGGLAKKGHAARCSDVPKTDAARAGGTREEEKTPGTLRRRPRCGGVSKTDAARPGGLAEEEYTRRTAAAARARGGTSIMIQDGASSGDRVVLAVLRAAGPGGVLVHENRYLPSPYPPRPASGGRGRSPSGLALPPQLRAGPG
ncbi:hypothetical protein THAOC_25777, partial [Thalassiosira oceanica]